MKKEGECPMSKMPLFAFAVVLAFSSAGPLRAQSGEAEYLSRFSGQWQASGLVRRNATSAPNKVSCKMAGNHRQNRAGVGGTCRAALIFKREISADLNYDPVNDRYTGVYKGSTIGPARLSGTRKGDVLTLNVRWPKPVNGDHHATMIINNPDRGAFSFIVIDKVAPDGPVEQMTNLTFAKP